eukprot:6201167-Pleurochrysis_carterae.AAC.1
MTSMLDLVQSRPHLGGRHAPASELRGARFDCMHAAPAMRPRGDVRCSSETNRAGMARHGAPLCCLTLLQA